MVNIIKVIGDQREGMTDSQSKGRHLKSVDRAFSIIQAVREFEGAGVTELAEYFELPKSTVHSYLTTLEQDGYLVNREGEYDLSMRFLALGEYKKSSEPLLEFGKKPLDDLVEETGERVTLLVEEHGLATIIYVRTTDSSVQTNFTPGTQSLLHASAGGKALLAHLPEEKLNTVITRWGLQKLTENTITDRRELEAELARIRDRGYAFSDEEYAKGIRAIAAPIFNGDGELQGAVGISGPAKRFVGDRYREELPSQLSGAANTIEVNIRYQSS